MWHADDDLVDAKLTTAFDDLFHRRDQAFAAIKTETLGAHVFDMEEFLKTLSLNQRVQDRLTSFFGEGDFLAVAFDTLFQPTRFFGVGDVHVLQRESTAIGALYDGDDLVHGCHFEAKHVVDKDRAVHVSGGKAVRGRIEFGVRRVCTHSQRVEVRNQVASNPVGADDHQGANAVQYRRAHLSFT